MLVIGLGMDWSWSFAFFPSYRSIGPHCVLALYGLRELAALSLLAVWILFLEKIKLGVINERVPIHMMSCLPDSV